MEKYNGWTNYATWRVNLEIFADYELSEYEKNMSTYDLSKTLENMVDEILSSDAGFNSLAFDYACSFVSYVNFYEIAQSLKDNEG